MNVKAIGWCALGAALALPAVVWGVQARVNFRDKTSNLVLSGFDRFGFKSSTDGTLKFDGEGKPALGVSQSQRLRVEALSWAGMLKKDGAGAYELMEAVLSGGVRIETNRDAGPVEMRAPKARFANAARRFDLEGGIVIVQTLSDGTLTLRSDTGYAALFETKPDSAPSSVRKAEMKGSVHVELRTQAKGVPAPTVLTADSATVVYDAVARTLTLAGGVKLTGDDNVMSGDATGSRAVVTLDASGKPIEVEMVGDPGVSHLTERKKGGR